jgi:hypothetical protein
MSSARHQGIDNNKQLINENLFIQGRLAYKIFIFVNK